MSNTWLGLIAALAYLVGSFPTAYFVAKGMTGKDIRFEGSGNIGGMNAYGLIKSIRSGRQAVLGLAIIQATDMGKGMLAISIARWLSFPGYNLEAALVISSFFVILGHNYPFYFRFKQGGMGLASLMGVLLALNESALLIWGGTIILSIIVAQYIQREQINWRSLSHLFSVIGQQLPGRLAGIAIALVPLYFFDPRLLFPVLAATILVLTKQADKIRTLVRESKTHHK